MKTEHAQVASIIRKELRRLGITGPLQRVRVDAPVGRGR